MPNAMASKPASRTVVNRSPSLTAAHPDLVLEIVPFTSAAQAESEAVDVRVLWLPVAEVMPGPDQALFPQETVFPLAHPALLPAALGDLRLIDKRTEGSGPEWDWSSWLGAEDARDRLCRATRFRDVGAALAAAESGMGAVLGRSLLVVDALNDGTLAPVLPPAAAKPCGRIAMARWSPALRQDSRVADLVAWLVRAASPG